jgi:hypothetical protein
MRPSTRRSLHDVSGLVSHQLRPPQPCPPQDGRIGPQRNSVIPFHFPMPAADANSAEDAVSCVGFESAGEPMATTDYCLQQSEWPLSKASLSAPDETASSDPWSTMMSPPRPLPSCSTYELLSAFVLPTKLREIVTATTSDDSARTSDGDRCDALVARWFHCRAIAPSWVGGVSIASSRRPD